MPGDPYAGGPHTGENAPDDERLGHVADPTNEKEIKELRDAPSGGIQTVVAGEGIEVDDTDAANPVISAPPSGASSTSAGLLADRPAAAAGNAGNLYFATDVNGGTLYRSNGSSWVKVALGLTEATPAGDPTEVVLGNSQLEANSASAPTKTRISAWPVWSLQDAATTSVGASRLLPASWATFDFDLWWTNLGATGGNARWEAKVFSSSDGDLLDAAVGAGILDIAAPAQNVVKKSTLATGMAVTSGDIVNITVTRSGSHANDTLAVAAGVLSVVLRKAS